MRNALRFALAVILGFSTILSSTFAKAVDPSGVSERGAIGIGQLSSCLQTGQSLDIFYVIDNSGSLDETDPDRVRANIIYDDVLRWGNISELRPKVKVRVNGAFFSSGSEPFAGGWQSVNPANADSVASNLGNQLLKKRTQDYTNWLIGLKSADGALSQSNADCKAAIWFTDGGLWIGGARVGNLDALSKLCGTNISKNSVLPTKPSNSGLLQQMRSKGIHLFGILLDMNQSANPDEAYWRAYMHSLAEETGSTVPSQGDWPSGNFNCGAQSTGEELDYAVGAYLVAKSPAEVALPFLVISSAAAGGSTFNIPADGNFYIDPGIRAIQILTQEASWDIKDEKGKVVATSKDAHPTGSSERIEVNFKESVKWHFSGKGSLVLYSDVVPELDPKTVFNGRATDVTGHFVRAGTNDAASLSEFKSAAMASTVDGKTVDTSFNQKAGTFSLHISSGNGSSINYEFALSLGTEHYPKFEPIVFQVTQNVQNSSAFPTVSQIKFERPLESGKDIITSRLKVTGPTEAAQGRVCFADVRIVSDNQHELAASESRADKWSSNWKGLGADGCLDVANGELKTLELSLANSVPKSSDVTGVANYTLASDQNAPFEDSQTFEFQTDKQRDWMKFVSIFLIAYLLSVGIPMLVLYLINSATKIRHGQGVMRASFPVIYNTITNDIRSNGVKDLRDGTIGQDDFPFKAPLADAKSFTDPDLGTLKVVVPLNPLRQPWFKIQASESRSVFTGISANTAQRGKTYPGGHAVFGGDLANLWAVSIDNSAMLASNSNNPEVPAKLVIFTKNQGAAGATNFTDMIIQTLAELKIAGAIADAKTRINAVNAKAGSKGGARLANPSASTTSNTSGVRLTPAPPVSGGNLTPPPPPPAGGPSAPPPPPRA